MYELLCAICQNPYRPRKITEFFCNDCYTRYREAILNKDEWVQYCVANEEARRKWDSYVRQGTRVWVKFVRGLGNDFDVLNGRVILINRGRNG